MNLDLKNTWVKEVSRDQAAKIILEYEWLGTMGRGNLYFGIFFDEHCAGVVCYEVGNADGAVNVHRFFGVKRREMTILARGACVFWAPVGTNSKLIGKSLMLLKKMYPRMKVIVAYADTEGGEIGTVYQATNWFYYGKTSKIKRLKRPDGYILNSANKSYYDFCCTHKGFTWLKAKKLFKKRGYKEIVANPKHRYCYILAKEPKRSRILKKIQKFIKPYPKRNAALG